MKDQLQEILKVLQGDLDHNKVAEAKQKIKSLIDSTPADSSVRTRANVQNLLTITVHTDCDSGVYQIGEMDFSLPHPTLDWLSAEEGNREKLAGWLEWLGDSCRKDYPPFGKSSYPNHSQSQQAGKAP